MNRKKKYRIYDMIQDEFQYFTFEDMITDIDALSAQPHSMDWYVDECTEVLSSDKKDIYENDIITWTCRSKATTGVVYNSREGFMIKDTHGGNVTKL
jgi:hypothetical protein